MRNLAEEHKQKINAVYGTLTSVRCFVINVLLKFLFAFFSRKFTFAKRLRRDFIKLLKKYILLIKTNSCYSSMNIHVCTPADLKQIVIRSSVADPFIKLVDKFESRDFAKCIWLRLNAQHRRLFEKLINKN